jgi:hypothetical protein
MPVRRTYVIAANGSLTVTDSPPGLPNSDITNAGNYSRPPAGPPVVRLAQGTLTFDMNGTWDIAPKSSAAEKTAKFMLDLLIEDLGRPANDLRKVP